MTEQKKDLMLQISGMGEQAAIDAVINEMWNIYDEDQSGYLDYDEVKKFVKDALATMCRSICFSEDIFAKLFRKFDVDGNELIDQDEIK